MGSNARCRATRQDTTWTLAKSKGDVIEIVTSKTQRTAPTDLSRRGVQKALPDNYTFICIILYYIPMPMDLNSSIGAGSAPGQHPQNTRSDLQYCGPTSLRRLLDLDAPILRWLLDDLMCLRNFVQIIFVDVQAR